MASLSTRPHQATQALPVAPEAREAQAAPARTYSIGVLVRRFHISAESLRNWERAGLIPQAHRTPGGHRRYGDDHLDAVHKLLYAPGALEPLEDADDDEAFDASDRSSPYPGHRRAG